MLIRVTFHSRMG